VTPNRKKAWVDSLLGKREAIEQAIGMPLGEMLGCGHWGCVFESTAPWVVKLSIDPTEGPIWSKIAGLVEDEVWGADGFVKVKSIHRLTPDLVVGGKKRKVWAIVREAVEPVFREFTMKELGEKGRGSMVKTSRFTNELLGFSGPVAASFLTAGYYLPKGSYKNEEFHVGLGGLVRYRDLATLWHLYGARRRTTYSADRIRGLESMLGVYSKDDAVERIEHVVQHAFSGAYWAPLGESLHMLATHEIYLRDVHAMNIGWHVPKTDESWTHIVIFDPGHTPTAGAEIETLSIEREAL